MLKVGIVGYGAIGRDVARYIQQIEEIELVAVLVRNKKKYQSIETEGIVVCDDEQSFFQFDLDVVIENAGHEAVYQYAEKALSSGCHFMVVSVGAFADSELLKRVQQTAEKHNKRIIIPSGAIAGLDRIAAAMFNSVEEVKLVTRKPPQAWIGTIVEKQINLNQVDEPICVFSGDAKESSLLFPESSNVSAALSIAGIGFERTLIEVFVDPHIEKNTHQIIAKGYFGEVEIKVQNTPTENPKTGYIVAMSICKVLKNFTSNLLIGI